MSIPTPLDLLVRGHQLIRDIEGWTQDNLATDECGKTVSPRSNRAVCFCARGALGRAQIELGARVVALLAARDVLDKESRRLFNHGILCVNDGLRGETGRSRLDSHKRVVMVYEEAIRSKGGEVSQ